MDATKYNLKEAYNKKLTGKARLHYLENFEHDMYTRKGYAGEYSGNHPKYSKGVAMMGDPKSPMKAMDDDLKYMPVEDIAGQGTEGVNMKTNPINNNPDPFLDPKPEGFVSDAGDPTDKTRNRRIDTMKSQIVSGANKFSRQNANNPEFIQNVQNTGKFTQADIKKFQETNPDDFKNLQRYSGGAANQYRTFNFSGPSMMKSPMKEQKYGGNKGDESRSRRDFAGPSMGHKSPAKMAHKSPMKEQKYGGNKGDLSRSRRDFEGPSMMKSPMKSLKFGRR